MPGVRVSSSSSSSNGGRIGGVFHVGDAGDDAIDAVDAEGDAAAAPLPTLFKVENDVDDDSHVGRRRWEMLRRALTFLLQKSRGADGGGGAGGDGAEADGGVRQDGDEQEGGGKRKKKKAGGKKGGDGGGGGLFLNTPSAIAIRIKELDECCCADVPCISIVKEYCESSSLHGLRYITEDGRHWTERVLWVLLCLCGFVLTVYFIYPIWAKWNEKPTITTLDSTDHPVWEIDFPAVTVCPANKVDSGRVAAAADEWADVVGSRQQMDKVIKFMVDFKGLELSEAASSSSEYQDISETVERLGLANLTAIMASVMPRCSDFLLRCWWQGRLFECADIFEVRKTNDGFCCSFNALRQSENVDFSALKDLLAVEELDDLGVQQLMEEGLHEFMPEEEEDHHHHHGDEAEYYYDLKEAQYEQEDSPEKSKIVEPPEEAARIDQQEEEESEVEGQKKAPPVKKPRIRRLNSANYQRGLTVVLDSKSEDYRVTSDDFVGFKILVHNPGAYPEVEGHSISVGSSREVFISVTASHTEGSKAILDFPFEGRSCLFSSERDFPKSEVTIFKDYTQENCLLECRAKLLLERCGCLPYFYPRLDLVLRETREEFRQLKNQSCTWQGWQCLKNASELLDAVAPRFHPQTSPATLFNADLLVRATNPAGRSDEGDDEVVTPAHAGLLLQDGAPCHCPPACGRTTYAATQSSAQFPNRASRIFRDLIREEKFQEDFGGVDSSSRKSDLSLVHVFFRDLKVFKYHTDELFSWENILASFGGLIGLCTGFSFLSAAELAYFFTLRCTLPLCRKRKRKDKVAMLNDTDLVVVKVEE